MSRRSLWRLELDAGTLARFGDIVGGQDLNTAIWSLRDYLGEARFRRFVASLRGRTNQTLLFWQDEVLDKLELSLGVTFPRSTGDLGAILLPLLRTRSTLDDAEVPDWIGIEH